jgi:hypothetical protein
LFEQKQLPFELLPFFLVNNGLYSFPLFYGGVKRDVRDQGNAIPLHVVPTVENIIHVKPFYDSSVLEPTLENQQWETELAAAQRVKLTAVPTSIATPWQAYKYTSGNTRVMEKKRGLEPDLPNPEDGEGMVGGMDEPDLKRGRFDEEEGGEEVVVEELVQADVDAMIEEQEKVV